MTLRCFQMLLARVCPTRQLAESFGKDKLAFPISFRYWVCTPVACDVSGDRPLIDAACCSVTNCDQLFATPWTIARQAPCPSPSPRLMSIESLMPSNHLILCHPLLLPSIFPSLRVFPNELALHIRWPKFGASASASVLQ